LLIKLFSNNIFRKNLQNINLKIRFYEQNYVVEFLFFGVFFFSQNFSQFFSKNYFENFQKICKIQICKLIFAENFIKNTILRNKIQNTYILRTNKFGKENEKYCSQKQNCKRYLQKYLFNFGKVCFNFL